MTFVDLHLSRGPSTLLFALRHTRLTSVTFATLCHSRGPPTASFILHLTRLTSLAFAALQKPVLRIVRPPSYQTHLLRPLPLSTTSATFATLYHFCDLCRSLPPLRPLPLSTTSATFAALYLSGDRSIASYRRLLPRSSDGTAGLYQGFAPSVVGIIPWSLLRCLRIFQ